MEKEQANYKSTLEFINDIRWIRHNAEIVFESKTNLVIYMLDVRISQVTTLICLHISNYVHFKIGCTF